MARRLFFLAGVLMASILFAFTAPPAAAQYNQPDTISVTPAAPPGGEVTVRACCYQAGWPVLIFAGWLPVGTAVSGQDKVVNTTIRLPRSSVPGSNVTITVFGLNGRQRASVRVLGAGEGIQELASAPGARRGSAVLPRTGDNIALPLSIAGAGLVAGGGLIVLAVRRRNEHTAV